MEICFVNHASFVCEARGTRILCDPWFEGSAFNAGWDLIAPTRFEPRDFERVDYIWLSHEHPDHFSPPTLKRVPEALRSRIVVLYKQTRDRRVLGHCQKLGFATRELEEGKPAELAPGVELRTRKVPLFDSWLSIHTPEATLLNLNDAAVHTPAALDRLRRELGSIDVLFTQFNYAAWRGNAEDTALRRADAQKKLELMQRQIEHLAPRYTVPFASFSYFSHSENAFINDAANGPSDALGAVARTSSTPVLLYPGDTWRLGAPHDNSAAEARYLADYASLPSRAPHVSPSVSFAELEQAARGYIERIHERNDRRVLGVLPRVPGLGLLGPIEIFLWDQARWVRFSFTRGLEPLVAPSGRYELALGSDSLRFLFAFPWGIDTLTVNGRFCADARGLKQLGMTFGVDALNNAGLVLGPRLLTDYETLAFLGSVLARKLWSLRKRAPSESSGAGLRPPAPVGAPQRATLHVEHERA
jgi:hypothetical protein